VYLFTRNSLAVSYKNLRAHEELPGWQEDVSGARSLEDLPSAARKYLERIEEISGAPIALVGVGSRRSQTILTASLYA
jgi:adenylosuccinate synthase